MSEAERYELTKELGEGQFAKVFLATDRHTNETVAIKRIKAGRKEDAADGLHRTAIREIKLLQELKHENIIRLHDVFASQFNINLVLELCKTDLEEILQNRQVFLKPEHIKRILIMLLQGLEYMHKNWILHRDLKPNNLFFTSSGVLKIADFGLATFFGSPSREYTKQVVTLWYRAPELFFGCKLYGVGIDMWAVGCIQAELELRTPLFPGERDIDQLDKIASLRGTPKEENWPGVTELPNYIKVGDNQCQPLNTIFTACDEKALELMDSFLQLDPRNRATASEALQHQYFSSKPYPCDCSAIPLGNKDDKEDASRAQKRKMEDDRTAVKRIKFDLDA